MELNQFCSDLRCGVIYCFCTMKTTFLFQVNLLLPASVFFDVIKKLLHNNSSTVRRKAMELLNSKLNQYAGSISDDQVFYP